MNQPVKLFCFGYGYTCDYIGAAVKERGWQVAGTTRDAEKLQSLRQQGIQAYLFDFNKPLDDPHLFLDGVTHILISTPPNDEGDPAFLMHGQDIANLSSLEWIGYLSSTSVYGDRGGAVVDETAEVQPSSKRGTRRAIAESQWLSLYEQQNLPVHVFRLAGIYGPGRSALESVRAGVARRIEKPGHAFSRIHVEDIVQTVGKSISNPDPGAVYNVCDNLPAPSHEVISCACDLLGFEPPPLIPYEEADMSPMAQSFYKDNKRTDNTRMREELGVKLKYPDYKSGLQGCLDAEKHPLAHFATR